MPAAAPAAKPNPLTAFLISRPEGRSWLSLKTWVKVWLLWLNVVWMAGIVWIASPVGYLTVSFTILSVPIAAYILDKYGGFVHALGWIRVPWLPLTAYYVHVLALDPSDPTNAGCADALSPLDLCVTADTDPALFVYVLVAVISIGVCCLLDVFNLVRWYSSPQQRFVLGDAKSVAMGHSDRFAREGDTFAFGILWRTNRDGDGGDGGAGSGTAMDVVGGASGGDKLANAAS